MKIKTRVAIGDRTITKTVTLDSTTLNPDLLREYLKVLSTPILEEKPSA